MKLLRSAFLLAAACPSGCLWQGVWVETDEAFEMEAAGVTGTQCEAHNGAIVVEASRSDDRVAVRAHKRAGASTKEAAEKALQAVEITRERRGDQIVLGWRWREEDADYRAEVSFEIRQAKGLAVRASTHNGEVRVMGPVADCKVDTHNGALAVTDCRGKLVATTHNGNVRVVGTLGDVTIETSNGSVTAEAPLGSPQGRIQTHNGSVVLRLGAAAGVELDCETTNGTVSHDLDLAVKRATRTSLSATKGTPSGRLVVRTHNGSVHVGTSP